MESMILPAGTRVKVDGLPFWLQSETEVAGNATMLKRIHQESSLGFPVVPMEAQSETCATISPSSESMNCLK